MDDKIGPRLRARLASATEYDVLDVNFFLVNEPAVGLQVEELDESSATYGEQVVEAVRARARASQRAIAPFLDALRAEGDYVDPETGVPVPRVEVVDVFWINNALNVEIVRDVLEAIVSRDEVAYAELVGRARMSDLLDEEKSSASEDDAPSTEDEAMPIVTRCADAGVEVVEDLVVTLVPNAAAEPTPNVQMVNAHLLWELGLRGDGVIVAVVDTGVNYDHPDLRQNMWDGKAKFPHHGNDLDTPDDDPMDEAPAINLGHGTACAGIIAGDGTSGTITGVAPRAKIMAVRVGPCENSITKGLQFAVMHGAHVISMSLTWKHDQGPNYYSWRTTCQTIHEARVLHANSTGNEGTQLCAFPRPNNIGAPGNCPPPWLHPLQKPIGGLSSAVSCGAVDESGNRLSDSGRGPCAWEKKPFNDYPYHDGAEPGLIKPDICAPGVARTCRSTFPGSSKNPYRGFRGTSAATPHVAGCMALLVQACIRSNNPIIPARMQEAIESTACRIPGQTKCKEVDFGAGRINIYAAYDYGLDPTRRWWE